MRLARVAIHHRGDYAGAHRLLTAAASMAGQADAAAAALAELRRVQPNISLDWMQITCLSDWRDSVATIWRLSAAPAWRDRNHWCRHRGRTCFDS
jgi:hypothetical protein